MEFRISDDAGNDSLSMVVLKKGQRLADGSWHQVHLIYGENDVSLTVDYGRPEYIVFQQSSPLKILQEDSVIVIGAGYSQPGLVSISNQNSLRP